MKLQQVKLSGFKSFVDNTSIEVHGQLVGIVGPNGCGKSNVIDAVRWVLGESSAKQLRGESMMDVIFNGSIKRKPVSRATVELVFDNSQKALYGLWNNYDEISIKRLISRQGESIYYINNQQVRRKDITDLFLGTGVGTKGYAVIEQGMISKIIESKPEDMRQFIEEAAGVSKYRERRKETLQRLADTADNLQRLEDIHSEIIKQLATLQEQAEVAKLHQSLTHQLHDTQKLSLAIKVTEANKSLAEANQFIQHCEDELTVLGYQLEEVNLQLTDEQDKKTGKEQELQLLVERFNEARTTLARVEERYKHYSDLLKRFESESINIANKEQEINLEIEELNQQQIVLAEQYDNNQFELSDLAIAREEQQIIVEDKQSAYDKVAEQVSSRQSVLNSLKHELELLTNSLGHKRQQVNNLQTRKAKLEQETQTLDFDQNYHFIKEEIELVEEELISGEISLQDKLIRQETLATEIDNLRHENNICNQQIAAADAKITTINSLLTQHNDEDSAIPIETIGEIWQFVRVAEGYEKAVESALGYLLTAKIAATDLFISPAPSSRVVLWNGNAVAVSANANSLASKVEILDNRLASIYNYLNHFVVSEFNARVQLAANQVGVTLDGHIFTRDYVTYNPSNGGINLLQLQKERDELNLQTLELQAKLVELATKLTDKLRDEQNTKNDISSLDAKHKRLLSKKHELQLEFTKQEQIFLQNQRHQERLSQEIGLLSQDITHLGEDIQELEIESEDKHIEYEDKLNTNQSVELQKVEAETSLQLAKNRLQDLDSRSNKLIVDNQLLKQQQQHAQSMAEDKRMQLAAAKQKLTELSTEREACSNNDQAQEIIELQQNISTIASSMQSVQQELDELSNKIIALKNKAGTINSSYQRNQEKINQTKFKQQEQQILLSTYNEQLDSGEFDPAQMSELVAKNSASIAELTAKIKLLESQIAALGLVNLKAIEDLEAAASKELELVTQVADLQNAKQTLEEAIEHIDNETRKLLQETFDSLNNAIVVYFRTLFGGGNARLALTDKDILNAGVQIYAEPPGKKNSTIHLLSGGEKALAAMSFIFALFSLNPAPFCLLDEVDAPLDDANTQRFCNLVQELSSKTQFVYISHNRLAMEMADQLVGVTMQEKGVSTVVSVSLVEAVKHAQTTE